MRKIGLTGIVIIVSALIAGALLWLTPTGNAVANTLWSWGTSIVSMAFGLFLFAVFLGLALVLGWQFRTRIVTELDKRIAPEKAFSFLELMAIALVAALIGGAVQLVMLTFFGANAAFASYLAWIGSALVFLGPLTGLHWFGYGYVAFLLAYWFRR